MKLLSVPVAMLLSLAVCRADISDIEALYRSILSQPENVRIPGPADLAGPVTGNNVLRDAPAERVEALLPLAMKCLESPNPEVRSDGMLLMGTVAVVRLDNASLLAPYFERVAAFLNDTDEGQKNGAIAVLSNGYPKPDPRALAYLAAHLNDQKNSGMQFSMIAGALLIASPSDPNLVRTLLTALRNRPDHELLSGRMIQALGHQKVTTVDAIEFIRAALRGKDTPLKRTAVDAVGNLPKDARATFAPDLQQLLANANESPEILSRAREVLIQ